MFSVFQLLLALVIWSRNEGGKSSALSSGSHCKPYSQQPEEGAAGVCIVVTECPELLPLLKGDAAQVETLRRSTCGFDNFDPLVCCPRRDLAATPTSIPLQSLQVLREKLPTNCGLVIKDRIIGGKNARAGSWPWVAALGYTVKATDWPSQGLEFLCGGALLSSEHVVTAAHCVDERLLPPGIRLAVVRLGENNLLTAPDCIEEAEEPAVCYEAQDFSIARALIHPEWKRSSTQVDNDIAIITLAQHVHFRENIQPICLDIDGKLMGMSVDPYVVGWGRINMDKYNPVRSNTLQELQIPLQSLEKCQNTSFYRKYTLSEKHLCAGGNVGEDSCAGDSGGPLMMNDEYGAQWYLRGLVSFGPSKCGNEDVPGIYTNVTNYHRWILENI